MSNTDCKAAKDMTEAFLADFPFTLALDEMGTRIDDLERNVAELMTQAGMEEQAVSK